MGSKHKPFNKYSLEEAYDYLHLTRLAPWEIPFRSIEPTAFFQEELTRMQAFDVTHSEHGKEVLIDAILKEALTRRNILKVWKEIPLKTQELSGRSEYVIAKRQVFPKQYVSYLANAPKDDFEKGLARCLLGMKACQLLNAKANIKIDMHGIVSNAAAWRFYKLTLRDEVYESPLYSFETQMAMLFGILDTIFATCEEFIKKGEQ